jgi:hypothetical protein
MGPNPLRACPGARGEIDEAEFEERRWRLAA